MGKWAFQRAVWRVAKGYDALIAHNLVEVNALAALRAVGLFRVPILAFVHSVSDKSVQKFTAHGADRLLVLNSTAEDKLVKAGVKKSRISRFDFGADLPFYQPSTVPSEFILSVGVSQRDHSTLIAAARATSLPVVIVGRLSEEQIREAPANVTVLSQGNYDLSFDSLLDLYRRARLVVVSHHGSDHPFGLNAVVEAMAMARAVILTRGRGIDIRPEALDFGLSVPPHDVEELGRAMTRLFSDAELCATYGLQARQLAETRFNTRCMSDALVASLAALRP